MKIYHLLANQASLQPNSGDRINEINFIIALSQFAEVYYNNHLFMPDEPDYGLRASEVEEPKEGYDLYYVRNNLEVFKKIKGKKIWFSYPYNEEAFRLADAVSTFNEAWKIGLENFHSTPENYDFFCGAYPKDMVEPKKVLNIKQVLGGHFEAKQGTKLHFKYRAIFGYGFTVGYFGRIVEETLPKDYLAILPELRNELPELNTVFAGSIRVPLNDDSIINVKLIPFEEMPFATSACDILLANEQPEANWAGSAKPLEAMACGVPLIVTKRPARVNQLGEDYPLYYHNREDLKSLIIKLYSDRGFYNAVKESIISKAHSNYAEQMAPYLESCFSSFLKEGKL